MLYIYVLLKVETTFSVRRTISTVVQSTSAYHKSSYTLRFVINLFRISILQYSVRMMISIILLKCLILSIFKETAQRKSYSYKIAYPIRVFTL